ncbi:MAG: hypothetical protein AB1540_17215 [Bdellovibrionota bacterium]
MKYLVLLVLSLSSSIAMADGFRCKGNGYNVKLYNQVDPHHGTKNPAILILSKRSIGTLAKIRGDDLDVLRTKHTVVYEGQTNRTIDGRFISIQLEVSRKPLFRSKKGDEHGGTLVISADRGTEYTHVACTRYRKTNR